MWPEKISDKMCGWTANEIVGISLSEMIFYALLVGMMAGIIGTLAVQFLWKKVTKVFTEVAEPEIAIADEEEKKDPQDFPEEPEPVEVHFHSRSCSVTRQEVLDPRWAPAWAAAQRTQEVHSSSCSSDSEGYVNPAPRPPTSAASWA